MSNRTKGKGLVFILLSERKLVGADHTTKHIPHRYTTKLMQK